jgi:restriction system protein
MEFNSIVQSVDRIESSKNYWFVRTDNGDYYQDYYEHGFIAIGWDYITIQDLQSISGTAFDIKQKIAHREGLDIVNNARDKGKVTAIFNKLKAFKNLNRGDIIVIPSENSQRLAFGFVADNQIFTNVDDPNCPFVKRRRINWVEEKDIDELDKIFYQIRISRHTISSIKPYEAYIDKVVKTLFIKNDYSHYVLDLQTDKDINFNTLLQLINNIRFLTEWLNNDFNLGENLDQNAIKLNLQSSGKIEFKFLNGKSLILLATLLGPMTLNSGLNNIAQNEKQQLENFRQVHQNEIEEIENALQELEVDRDKINSIY